MIRTTLLPTLALGCLLSLAAVALAEQVTELHANGKPKAKYSLDDEGRRSGGYIEFYESGQVKSRSQYSRGALQGLSTSFHENRKPHVTAYYRKGLLHGKYVARDPEGRVTVETEYVDGKIQGTYSAFRDGEPVSVQEWDDGTLLTLDGIEPFPRTKDEIRKQIEEIYNHVDPLENVEGDELAWQRGESLRQLMIYRYLSFVPWMCELDAELNRNADAAANLVQLHGELSHTPPNPGLPEDEYKYAYKGTSSSNLHRGGPVETSVRGYMDDSDARNIAAVGHRRWCLFPPLLKTGFGSSPSRTFNAMWSFDRSRRDVPDYEYVAFPGPGFQPDFYFADHFAWNVSLNRKHFAKPDPARVKARVYDLGDDYVKGPEPLKLNFEKVHQDGAGLQWGIIFRAEGVRVKPGARYWVEIDGLMKGNKPKPLHYVVEFFAL